MTTAEVASNPLGSASPNRGVKRGLPDVGLPTAEQSAAKLWSVARRGTTSKEAYAKQLGWNKTSGNHWDKRMALLRGFGLIKATNDQIGLSELGLQIVNESNPDGQIIARRTALMKLKAYRELVESFDGTALPDITVLASRLQYDYGKKEEFAGKAAQAFVDSLKHARMLDDTNTVHREGCNSNQETALVVTDVTGLDDGDDNDTELDRAFNAEEEEHGAIEGDVGATVETENINLPAVTVSMSVNLDLSKYRADEVVQILRALGAHKGG
jgi:hypothetical protein